jgi:hypothetical protein
MSASLTNNLGRGRPDPVDSGAKRLEMGAKRLERSAKRLETSLKT